MIVLSVIRFHRFPFTSIWRATLNGGEQFDDMVAHLWSMFSVKSFDDYPLHIKCSSRRHWSLCPLSFLRPSVLRPALFRQSPDCAPIVHALQGSQRHIVMPAVSERWRQFSRRSALCRLFRLVARCRTQDVSYRSHCSIERINASYGAIGSTYKWKRMLMTFNIVNA